MRPHRPFLRAQIGSACPRFPSLVPVPRARTVRLVSQPDSASDQRNRSSGDLLTATADHQVILTGQQ